MNKYNRLIDDLSKDLAPVAAAPRIDGWALAWFVASAVYVVIVTQLFGPLRPGAFSQLVSEPRFLLECLLGVVAILWASLLAFRDAVPAALSRGFAAGGLFLVTVWLAQYLFGLYSPALEPSSLGERHYCYLETILFALPPVLAGIFLVRRLYPLHPIRTAMALGLAAGMLPALYMQLACMYEPVHILTFHILPGLTMVLVSGLIALLWRRQAATDIR
jgi:hypothetical protein